MRLSDVVIDDREVDRAHAEWVRQMSDLYDNGFGSVSNIAFDLRHELLPREQWIMPKFGLSPDSVREDTDEPNLWLPWFGPAEVGSIWPIYTRPRISHDKDDILAPLIIETILQAFDQVVIESVVAVATDHVLEHQHDSEIRCAYLLIKRPDGTTTRPNIPLVFRGRHELLNANRPLDVLRVIERRMSESYDPTKSTHGNKYADRSFCEFQALQDMLRHVEFYDASRLVGQGVLVGYLQAKVETEVEIKHKALARIKASEASSRGGKQSATKNSNKADKAWRLEAAECVKAIYQEDNSLSDSKIIDLLSIGLGNNRELPYGEKTLKAFVRNMRESGQIGAKIQKPKLAGTSKIPKR